MARVKVGSLLKAKDGKGVYFKASMDFSVQKDKFLSVATKKEQIVSLEEAVRNGKIKPENGEKIRERLETIPEFVFAEVFMTKE
jgi:hypothetical protein